MRGSSAVIAEAEVVVVGAGPAGTAAAATLAGLGREVVLIDQDDFPREKPCGDGLTYMALGALERLDVTHVLHSGQPIEGTRFNLQTHAGLEEEYRPQDGRQRWAHVVRRAELDQALLESAVGRGAQFLRARAERLLLSDSGQATGVEVDLDGERAMVAAGHVIAADGATSRMRRTSPLPRPAGQPAAYAVRAYFETEHELDALFDLYYPLRLGQASFAGYGWVFPVGPNLANVGVGCYRAAGLSRPPSIRTLLGSFVEELQHGWPERFGRMRATGKPFGSPVAVNFCADACEFANVAFVGDAARTVDPLTGEGIAYALRGGETVAGIVAERLAGRSGRPSVGSAFRHAFPRLGKRVLVLARASLQTGGSDRCGTLSLKPYPMLDMVTKMVPKPPEEPSLRATPVWKLANALDPDRVALLDEVNRRLVGTIQTEFPFVVELAHREMRARSGPVAAAICLFAAAGSGEEPSDALYGTALALQLISLAPRFMVRMARGEGSRMAKLNDSLAILVGDFLFGRTLSESAALGPDVVERLARAIRSICHGHMLDIEDLYGPERTVERYMAAIESKSAVLHSLAASLGGELAGLERATIQALAAYGHELGLALQIADDLAELVGSTEVTGKPAAQDLRDGSYTLAVICAANEDPSLRARLLEARESDHALELVGAIEAVGGLDRAAERCRHHAERARAGLQSLRQNVRRELLEELAGLPVQRVADAETAPVRLGA